MCRFSFDLKTVLVCSILFRASAQYLTESPVGPCATVRCGFNTRCYEFNGVAGCYNTTCSSGEVFTECSSYCEPTCVPQNIACIQSCGPPACQCQPGFVRYSGLCVGPSQCPNRSTTPSYVDEPITPPLENCDQALVRILCVTGYHCEIVNGAPQCVPDRVEVARCAEVRVKCPAGNHCEDTPAGITCAPDPPCPDNEVFNICASDCEETCVPMGRPCSNQCLPAKCQCKSGFVREGGKCIDPSSCSNRRPVITSTLNYADEPITPPMDNCDLALVRILCVTGFHCEIVSGTPQCVPDRGGSKAPTSQTTTCASIPCAEGTSCVGINGIPQCLPNPGGSQAPTSPTTAPLTCASTLCAQGTRCEEIDGIPQCLPNPGACATVRCGTGECIEYDDTYGCFNTTCGENEEFMRCASCEPTCGPIVPCLPNCFPPACQCSGGYVRDNGKCIRRTDCKNDYIGRKSEGYPVTAP